MEIDFIHVNAANMFKCLERQSDVIMFCQFVYQVIIDLHLCCSIFQDIRRTVDAKIYLKRIKDRK